MVGNSRDDQDSLYDDPLTSDPVMHVGRFDTEKRHATLQSDLSLANDSQILTLGVDYVDDRVDSDTPYDRTSRDNTGVFGQYQAQFGAHHALLSARYDDNEQFGSYSSGSVGWKWAFAPNLALTAAWGSAFGAPTFNDLYFPGFSNPDLDPETSRSYELGLSGNAGALRWSLVGFENRIDDLIVFDPSISRRTISTRRASAVSRPRPRPVGRMDVRAGLHRARSAQSHRGAELRQHPAASRAALRAPRDRSRLRLASPHTCA